MNFLGSCQHIQTKKWNTYEKSNNFLVPVIRLEHASWM